MVIRCITNRLGDLSEDDREYVSRYVHMDNVNLVRSQHYVVYGIVYRSGRPWYLIAEKDDAEYPVLHFAGLFELIGNKAPRGWGFYWNSGHWPEGAFIPMDWSNSGFFEALLDGSRNEVDIYRTSKVEMDNER